MKLKPTKQMRKKNRIAYVNTIANIPYGSYCSDCIYKRVTPKLSDYFICSGTAIENGNLIAFKNKEIKISRRRVFCSLNKRRSYDDICMSDGLKWCGIKWYEINECPS